MTCDRCSRKFNYSYYIDERFWRLANGGRREGYLCAHCLLERLGGVDWYIVFNEPLRHARTGFYGDGKNPQEK